MKKPAIVICAITIAGIAAVAAFPQRGDAGGSLPAEEEKSSLCATVEPSAAYVYDTTRTESHSEAKNTTAAAASESMTELPRDSTPTRENTLQSRDSAHESEGIVTVKPTTTAPPSRQDATVTASDPYHTDVYPNNVYSEEYLYDAEGNLVGKTTTIPTAFGPDAIWIDGHAYYDVPGFGLIEWGGPNQRTEDYTMYESGVKVGIMGGGDETLTGTSAQPKPQEWPEPIGETIDQTINTVPERSTNPPDWRPNSGCEYEEGE